MSAHMLAHMSALLAEREPRGPIRSERSSWTGKDRLRCLIHDRVAYADEATATSAAETIAASGRPGTERFKPWYGGDYQGAGSTGRNSPPRTCGWWHVTSKRRRR